MTADEVRARWTSVRCLFESPILDDHKWSKIPGIPADAFILDIEDSVRPEAKSRARDKVVHYLGAPEYFGGALVVPRVNHLDTPWGEADVDALGSASPSIVMYPKTTDVDDVERLLARFRDQGCEPVVFVCLETAQGVMNATSILQHPSVAVAAFGPGDLHADLGVPLYASDGSVNPTILAGKTSVIMSASAVGVPLFGIPYVADVRDLDVVRASVETEKFLGCTGCCAFYPPHVEIINDVYSRTSEELERAQEIIDAFAAAGPTVNAVTMDGKVLLVHDLLHARQALSYTKIEEREVRT